MVKTKAQGFSNANNYAALRNIAGRDPAREMNLNHNSPEVIRFFKERYLYRGKDD